MDKVINQLAMGSSGTRMVVVLMVLLPLMTTTSVVATPSSIEHCLRLLLNPAPPPPKRSPPTFDLGRIVCRDAFRAISHSLQETGKLPLAYLSALCNIFQDNEEKVERYVTRTFRSYDSRTLIAGRHCATIRKRHHAKAKPPSLSFFSRL